MCGMLAKLSVVAWRMHAVLSGLSGSGSVCHPFGMQKRTPEKSSGDWQQVPGCMRGGDHGSGFRCRVMAVLVC